MQDYVSGFLDTAFGQIILITIFSIVVISYFHAYLRDKQEDKNGLYDDDLARDDLKYFIIFSIVLIILIIIFIGNIIISQSQPVIDSSIINYY